jgi:hypothetical protein
MGRNLRRGLTGIAAPLALAFALAACGSSSTTTTAKTSTEPGTGKPAVVIGDKNFPEEGQGLYGHAQGQHRHL